MQDEHRQHDVVIIVIIIIYNSDAVSVSDHFLQSIARANIDNAYNPEPSYEHVYFQFRLLDNSPSVCHYSTYTLRSTVERIVITLSVSSLIPCTSIAHVSVSLE